MKKVLVRFPDTNRKKNAEEGEGSILKKPQGMVRGGE